MAVLDRISQKWHVGVAVGAIVISCIVLVPTSAPESPSDQHVGGPAGCIDNSFEPHCRQGTDGGRKTRQYGPAGKGSCQEASNKPCGSGDTTWKLAPGNEWLTASNGAKARQ